MPNAIQYHRQRQRQVQDSCIFPDELNFWNVHGIMNTSGLLQSNCGFMLTLQKTRGIYVSMNIPKIELITYIFILLLISNIYRNYS